MPLYDYTFNSTQTPQGTLQSNNLYYQPPVPQQSQARGGVRGADNRAYVGDVQGNELVRNQLQGLLDDPSSAYMRNARYRGQELANRRGLGNSSIAAGASQRAAIESGLPIAQADAATYLQSRFKNQDALNEGLMQERDIANRMLQSSRESGTQLTIAQMQQEAADRDRLMRLQLQRENLAYSGEQAGLDRQQQEMMSRLGYGQDIGRMGFADQLAYNDAYRQDWLQSNQFNRDLYGSIALNMQQSQLRNQSDFYNALAGGLISNPEVFGDPQFLSGMNEFFNSYIFDNQFDSILEALFGGYGP